MPAEAPIRLRIAHRYATAAERVFDAWLDPAVARRFLFATPEGQVVRAEIDARVGGRFTIVDRRGADDVEHTGEYLEIDSPRRLVFSFRVPKHSELAARVALDLRPLDHGCELLLTHEMDASLRDYAARTEAGWAAILDRLDTALA